MNNSMKVFDEYNLKARVLPSALCIVPFLVLKHYLLDAWLVNHPDLGWFAGYLGDSMTILVLVYLLTHINRTASKVLFEDKKEFPTTRYLLPSSKELSNQYRNSIDVKVRTDFGLSLPALADEVSNLEKTKKEIIEIVQLVINKVRNGHLVFKHNVEYGFFRNLAGGSSVAILVSLITLCFSVYTGNTTLQKVTLVTSLVYFLLTIFAWLMLKHNSKEYARVLFREYAGS
jgi:hypothetical protein